MGCRIKTHLISIELLYEKEKKPQQFPSKVLTDKCRIKTHLIRTELLYEKTKEKGKKTVSNFQVKC